MFVDWRLGYVASLCLLAGIVGAAGHVSGYKKFGGDCRDISCPANERCVLAKVACEKDQQDGEHCGQYPTCVEHSFGPDQHLNRFSIDPTSTAANTRSISALISSPSTNTFEPKHQTATLPDPDSDAGFEVLDGAIGAVPSASHADQRQANVLVIVQDGAQQSLPNANPNFNTQPWRQPCIVSPYYPYACTSGPSPYLPVSRSMPPYINARTGTGPKLVPPTPPCYFNCYPRLTAGYPLGAVVKRHKRSARGFDKQSAGHVGVDGDGTGMGGGSGSGRVNANGGLGMSSNGNGMGGRGGNGNGMGANGYGMGGRGGNGMGGNGIGVNGNGMGGRGGSGMGGKMGDNGMGGNGIGVNGNGMGGGNGMGQYGIGGNGMGRYDMAGNGMGGNGNGMGGRGANGMGRYDMTGNGIGGNGNGMGGRGGNGMGRYEMAGNGMGGNGNGMGNRGGNGMGPGRHGNGMGGNGMGGYGVGGNGMGPGRYGNGMGGNGMGGNGMGGNGMGGYGMGPVRYGNGMGGNGMGGYGMGMGGNGMGGMGGMGAMGGMGSMGGMGGMGIGMGPGPAMGPRWHTICANGMANNATNRNETKGVDTKDINAGQHANGMGATVGNGMDYARICGYGMAGQRFGPSGPYGPYGNRNGMTVYGTGPMIGRGGNPGQWNNWKQGQAYNISTDYGSAAYMTQTSMSQNPNGVSVNAGATVSTASSNTSRRPQQRTNDTAVSRSDF